MRFEKRRVALVLLLGPICILPWVKVALVLQHPPTVRTTVRAEGVVWANRVFVNRHALAVWLLDRGAHYDVWARNHPAVAGAPAEGTGQKSVKGAPSRPASGRKAASPTHPSPVQAQPQTIGSTSWVSRLGWLALAVVLTGGLVVAVVRSVQRVGQDAAEDFALLD